MAKTAGVRGRWSVGEAVEVLMETTVYPLRIYRQEE